MHLLAKILPVLLFTIGATYAFELAQVWLNFGADVSAPMSSFEYIAWYATLGFVSLGAFCGVVAAKEDAFKS